jgi:hypothetical protein
LPRQPEPTTDWDGPGAAAIDTAHPSAATSATAEELATSFFLMPPPSEQGACRAKARKGL